MIERSAAAYRARMRELGAAEHEIDRELIEMVRIETSLLAGKCPKCSAAIVRRVDPRQVANENLGAGVWHNIRCEKNSDWGVTRRPDQCDFFCDVLVPS